MTTENIIIGDYLFTSTELSIDNTKPYHELVTTKIMGGTSHHRLGEWTPIKFTATVPYIFSEIEEVNKVITGLHGTFQEILCPYVSDDLFNAYVKVTKEINGPEVISLSFEIEQVGDEASFTPISSNNGFVLEESVNDTE